MPQNTLFFLLGVKKSYKNTGTEEKGND